MAAWDDVIADEDRAVFEAGGWGGRVGFGERPVLLVVDVNYNFVGDRPEPILESMKRWRYSCGERGWEGVRHLAGLVEAARRARVPIIYTTMERRPDGADQGVSSASKSSRAGETIDVIGSLGNRIVAEIGPHPEDLVVIKPRASAFVGTPLTTHLIGLGADTIIVTGTTTSGCVRAAAVDASQLNYRVIIPEECTWDRVQLSHKVNLFDLNMKYGDVLPTQEVITYLESLEPDINARGRCISRQPPRLSDRTTTVA